MAKPLRIAIIGSGLGGAVLSDVVGGHHDLTVFERGPSEPRRPEPAVMTSHRFGLYPSFGYGLGGTTNYWQGGLVELLPAEMGTAWPEALKSELPRYYSRVVKQLYGERLLQHWRAQKKSELVDGMLIGSAFRLLPPFRAAESGFFNMARVLTDHRVERLAERAGGVDVVSRTANRTATDRFDRVVIAAGGLNSPIILQNSGLGGPEVGRNLTDHPMGFVAKLGAAGTPSEAFSALRAEGVLYNNTGGMLKVRDAETGLWSAFHLRSACGGRVVSDPYRLSFKFLGETSRVRKYLAALPQLRDPDFLYQAVENHLHYSLPSSHAYVLVVNEQEAEGQGSVHVDRHGRLTVDWRISDGVEGAIRRNLDRVASYTKTELILPKGSLRDRLWSGAHYSGTCRISPDANTGVVDQELRVHGTRHIYVCDGSVLPSTGATNTGLTIAAMAHYLGERLQEQRRPRATSAKNKCLLISGTTGAVGQMMRARLASLGFDWRAVDLRDSDLAQTGHSEESTFLHLANVHHSVAENLELQRRAALLADAAGIKQVIVPMSTSTIETASSNGTRPDAENLGFSYSGTDPYPLGKLAAERFWLDWQSAALGRRLALVYVPTILGPRSNWTSQIANHAPGKVLIVPQLERFLALGEAELVDVFAALFAGGLPPGVSRHLAGSSHRSLAEAISDDRTRGPVKVVRLPGFMWRLVSLSQRIVIVNKALSAIRTISDRLLRQALGCAIVPVSPRYLHLFRRQSDMADTMVQSGRCIQRISSAAGTTQARPAATK